MKIFRTKTKRLPGTRYAEINRKAQAFYQQIKQNTKRQTYVRSKYFKNEKIFLEPFWQHLLEKKNWRDRARRAKFFPAAIELIKNSRHHPTSKPNPNKKNELLHRFTGITSDGHPFTVQIKENINTNKKWLISVFPTKNKRLSA